MKNVMILQRDHRFKSTYLSKIVEYDGTTSTVKMSIGIHYENRHCSFLVMVYKSDLSTMKVQAWNAFQAFSNSLKRLMQDSEGRRFL